MRQSTSAIWRTELTPPAEKKLDIWLRNNNYGSFFDPEFIALPQLPIGVCIEFMVDFKIPFTINNKTKEPIEVLEKKIKEFLEAKN